jgi:hypothetical protein
VTHRLHASEVVHESAHPVLEPRSEALRVDGNETLTQVGGSIRLLHPAPNIGSEGRSCKDHWLLVAIAMATARTSEVH